MLRRVALVFVVVAATLVTAPAGAAPAPPTLSSAVTRDAGVALTWTTVAGATSYEVHRGLSPAFICGTPVKTSVTDTFWTDFGLLNKVRYYYKVTARDATGASACSNELNAVPGVQPYRWDFNRAEQPDTAEADPLEGWVTANGAGYGSEGLLGVLSSTADPSIYSPGNLGIDAATNTSLEIRMVNFCATCTTARVFWITDADQVYDAAKSKSFAITTSPVWTTYTISGLPSSWTGTIDQLRFDPQDPSVAGSWSFTDYIKVGTATTPPTPLTGAIFFPSYGSKSTNFPKQYFVDYDFMAGQYGFYDDDHPDHQKLMDEQIIQARNAGIDYFAFYFFGSYDPRTQALVKYLADFRNSTQRGTMKYTLIPIFGFNACDEVPGICFQWVGGGDFPLDQTRWRTSDVPWLLDRMDDSYYLRVDGNRPALQWCCGLDNMATQWTPYDPGDESTLKPDGFGDCTGNGCWSDELNYLRDQAVLRTIEGGGGPLGEPYNVNATDEGIDNASQYGFAAARRPIPDGTNWEFGDRRASFFTTAKASTDAFATTVPGVKQWPGIKAVNDRRARNCGSGVWWWADNPTYGQWEEHYRTFQEGMQQFPGRYSNPPANLIYAWNELEEAGAGIAPTVSEGSLYLDAIKAVKDGTYSSTYYDLVNDSMMSTTTASEHGEELYSTAGTPLRGMQFSAGWTWAAPSQFDPGPIQYNPDFTPYRADDTPCAAGATPYSHANEARGMYYNDEHTSATAGNSVSLPWANATGFSLLAATGPDRGKADVSIDGGAPTTIDLYSSTLLRQRRVFNVTGLTAGISHTITITVRSDKNPLSTGNKVGIDAIRAQVGRSLTAPAQTTTPPTRLVADRNDTRVELSWDRVPGATTYYVYRGTTNNFTPGTPLATVSEPTSSDGRVRYDNTGLSNSTIYYYVVRTGSTSGPNSTQVSASPLARLTAISTSSNAGGTPGNATDTSHTTAWTPTNGNPGTYLQVNLATSPNPGVSATRFYIKETGAKVNGFKLRYSTDYGVNWTDYYSGTGIGETGATSSDYRARSITVPLLKDPDTHAEIKVTNVRFELTTATTGGAPNIRVFHSYFR